MSEFLIVVPDGWTELPFSAIETSMDFTSAQAVVTSGVFYEFENALEASGNLPAGKTVLEVKVFNDGSIPRLWIRFGDI